MGSDPASLFLAGRGVEEDSKQWGILPSCLFCLLDTFPARHSDLSLRCPQPRVCEGGFLSQPGNPLAFRESLFVWPWERFREPFIHRRSAWSRAACSIRGEGSVPESLPPLQASHWLSMSLFADRLLCVLPRAEALPQVVASER